MESATIYANSGSYASTFDWGSVKVDTETGYIKGKSINTEIKQVELGISSFKANVATPQNVGTAITLSLTSIGGIGTIQSKYVVFDGVKWIVIKNYSTQPNVTWRPSKAGTYTLYACVKDNTGKIEKKSMTYVIKSPLKVTSFTSNLASPQKIGQGIKLSSTSSGGTGTIQIKYVVFDGLKWSIIKNYSTQVNATWKPSNVGNYTLYACVMDRTGEIIKKTINYVIK